MPTKKTSLPTVRDLVDAGAHFGHRRSRSHPKSRQYVYTIRDRVLVLDLEKTREKLESAVADVETLAAQGKSFLFVGTKPQAREAIKATAERVGMPYVTHRWLGGTLTNYETIRANLEKLARLDEIVATEEFEQFTKKERGRIDKERAKLLKIFGGIRHMGELPSALIVVDITEESIAVEEANRLGLPIVAIVDTNADPSRVTHPIPANDDSRRTIELVLNLVADAIEAGKAKAPALAAKPATETKAEQMAQDTDSAPATPEATPAVETATVADAKSKKTATKKPAAKKPAAKKSSK